jgi:hypothetical protein
MQIYGANVLSLDFVNNLAMVNGEDYGVDRNMNPSRQNVFQQYGGPLTFSRGTQAMVTDNTGNLTYAPNNLLIFSEQFDNPTWIKSRSSITPNVIADPFGNMTADKLVEDTTASNNHQIQFANTGNTNYSNYIFSIYLKQGERRYAQVRIACSINGTPNVGDVVVDLQTGIITATNNTLASGITALGNGWYRVWSMQAHTNASQIQSQVFLSTSSAYSANPVYTGNGVSGIFIWGAQLEAVTYQTQPRAYIPTTTTAYFGPRFDYDPVTRQPRGLLIEEARTNLIVDSNQITAGTGTTVSLNVELSPDGTINADKLIEATTDGVHWTIKGSIPVIVGQQYIYSGYLKAAERTVVDLYVSGNLGGVSTRIDLTNGSILASSAGLNVTVTNVGSGWYRVTYNCTATSTGVGGAYIQLRFNNNSSYLGDGTSGVFVWGQQFEAGSFATSYIPTVASTVTRSADQASISSSAFNQLYNQNEGTIAANFITLASATDGYAVSTGTNRVGIRRTSSDRVTLYNRGGVGINNDIVASGTYGGNILIKAAARIKSGNSAISVNNASAVTSSNSFNISATILFIGALSSSSGFLNGWIQQLTYIPFGLPNAQLQQLTA